MATQAKEIFEAQTKSLRELLSDNGLGLYLPPYQRAYSWDRRKVEKLLDDTLHGLKTLGTTAESFTFLGTVITIHDVNHVTVQPILKPEVPSKVLTIIDGQQRISSLLLVVAQLHNLIRLQSWRVFKGTAPDSQHPARQALYSETVELLQTLGTAFYERKNFGDSPIYPRLIRAFDDQWSKDAKQKEYSSPIANLIYCYSVIADAEVPGDEPQDFRPLPRPDFGKGESDLVSRFKEIRRALERLARQVPVEELEALPKLGVLAADVAFQQALFNHELSPELCEWLEKLDKEPAAELARLVMLAAYVLNRIALTVVQGKDEEYAFTIFESLNTTGEPLTAFETFLPRVVMAEKIKEYRESDAHGHMIVVENYLDRFRVGEKSQTATAELLVTFALAESGKKLSKRLPDQRTYMKESFEKFSHDKDERNAYLKHLSDTASFIGEAWAPVSGERNLPGLEASVMTDTVKLCLEFLTSLNHTIAIAPLVRFYSAAVNADASSRGERAKDFESAIKAITAFTVFWRATRHGTGNIDSEYRAVMSGELSLTDMGPLARSRTKWDSTEAASAVNVELLKRELVARLSSKDHGGIANLSTFISAAQQLPIYTENTHLARFLLLAAYHDSVEDPDQKGMIMRGKEGVAPSLTSAAWVSETQKTVEHVAPQEGKEWSVDFYTKKETVHRIGNLVLIPSGVNASVGLRRWVDKRVLYAALGASSQEEARATLDAARVNLGVSFGDSTNAIVAKSHYLPQLRALGNILGEWDVAFTEARAEVLLRLAYSRLKDWLGLELTEASSDPVTAIPEDDDLESAEYEESDISDND